MVEFCLTLFLSFPGCFHPGLVGVLPLSGLTAPVWSPGRFWLLGAGSRLASPLRLLALSFSGVGACGRQGVVSPHSIGTKPALVSCLIFLQDGVPLSGLDL